LKLLSDFFLKQKQKNKQQLLFLDGIRLICVIKKRLNIFKLLFKHFSVLLPFAF